MTASHLLPKLHTMSELTIIVATDARRGIGINNTLPWRLPEDLAHFKRITSGHTIIMGRKTFDSLGRPLPNRRKIILTRQTGWQHDGVETVASLASALALAGDEPAFIIGGAEIYSQALTLCKRLIVTEIAHNFNCDAFFPAIDVKDWQETQRIQHHSEQNALDYAFVTYQKI